MSETITISNTTVTLFSDELWEKLDELDLDAEIFEEVCWVLKYIPPSGRIPYLERVFDDMLDVF